MRERYLFNNSTGIAAQRRQPSTQSRRSLSRPRVSNGPRAIDGWTERAINGEVIERSGPNRPQQSVRTGSSTRTQTRRFPGARPQTIRGGAPVTQGQLAFNPEGAGSSPRAPRAPTGSMADQANRSWLLRNGTSAGKKAFNFVSKYGGAAALLLDPVEAGVSDATAISEIPKDFVPSGTDARRPLPQDVAAFNRFYAEPGSDGAFFRPEDAVADTLSTVEKPGNAFSASIGFNNEAEKQGALGFDDRGRPIRRSINNTMATSIQGVEDAGMYGNTQVFRGPNNTFSDRANIGTLTGGAAAAVPKDFSSYASNTGTTPNLINPNVGPFGRSIETQAKIDQRVADLNSATNALRAARGAPPLGQQSTQQGGALPGAAPRGVTIGQDYVAQREARKQRLADEKWLRDNKYTPARKLTALNDKRAQALAAEKLGIEDATIRRGQDLDYQTALVKAGPDALDFAKYQLDAQKASQTASTNNRKASNEAYDAFNKRFVDAYTDKTSGVQDANTQSYLNVANDFLGDDVSVAGQRRAEAAGRSAKSLTDMIGGSATLRGMFGEGFVVDSGASLLGVNDYLKGALADNAITDQAERSKISALVKQIDSLYQQR